MINAKKAFNIHDYIEIVLRRIWYIIIPLVLVAGAAAVYAKLTPRIYMASTTILVTPQKVPVEYVRPTVTSKIEDRLHSISQEIMSRTQLEKVISEFNLYAEEAKKLAGEEIIEVMRKNITVTIGGKEGYFAISYQGRDPVTVTKVTNRLASLFVEENLKLREQQAQGTTEFLALELNTTKSKLEEQEKILTEFKQKHLFELPDRVVTNLGVLTQLRQDQQRVSAALNSAMERKILIQKQIAEIQKQAPEIKLTLTPPPAPEAAKEEALSQNNEAFSVSTAPVPADRSKKYMTPAAAQLEKAKANLMQLKTRYTESHPDVVSTKKAIQDLEKVVAAELEKMLADAEKETADKELKAKKMAEENVSPLPGQKGGEDFNPQVAFTKEMEGQLAVTGREIQNLQKEEAKIRADIAIYQGRVENAPLREMMMANLSRDYQSAKENYQKLLDKSVQAQQAENLEKRQKGEQFRVIDPARIPQKPFKPDVPKIILLGLALGIGSGVGLAFLREQMDHSFRDAEDLEATMGFKVLTNIPKIERKAA